MPKPGDRVIIEGTKLGAVRREGELLEAIGSLLKIRWSDGSESLLTPGAGAVRFAPAGSKRGNSRTTTKSTKAAKTPARAKKAAVKKPAASKAAKKATKKR
jgi:hypothetical protein